MDKQTTPDSVSVAGRTTSATDRELLLDREWLAANYAEHGDEWIARHLRCNRKTVAAARALHGIASAPRGPRPLSSRVATAQSLRISPPDLSEQISALAEFFKVSPVRAESLCLIAVRSSSDTAAPTETVIRDRIVGLHHARGNPQDRIFALTDLASAVALNLEHELMLRRQR